MEVSDKTLEMDGDGLTSSSEAYVNRINGLSMDSIDLSPFNRLTEFGIATNFPKELKDALVHLKSGSMELARMIIAMIEQHQSLDGGQTANYYNNSGRNGGGSSGGISQSGTYEELPEKNEVTPTGEELVGTVSELSSENLNALFNLLILDPDRMMELLAFEDNASLLKEELLKDKNIPNDLKEQLLNLEDKELQKQLIEYFSKIDIEGKFKTLIDESIEINVREAALVKIYKDLDNINSPEKLLSIYDGGVDISPEAFQITRVFLDSITSEKDVTVEMLLTENRFNDYLNTQLQEFRKVVVLYNIKNKVVIPNE